MKARAAPGSRRNRASWSSRPRFERWRAPRRRGARAVAAWNAALSRASADAADSCHHPLGEARAASTYVTSLSTSSAWSGVFVRVSRTMQVSRAGRVERDHRRRGNGPLPERVEAAAIETRPMVLDVVGVGQLVPEPRRLVRFDRGTADPLDQEPAPGPSAWSRIISAGSRSRGPAPAGGCRDRASELAALRATIADRSRS